ncbi:jg16712 [Pararge aegeria aegeria]|uniref:Jg16712 protein n=1 Tax=Pararge aegeria aegeria TaxID=348720 RepID=A0A8S4RKJ3_9NEOP|nr:jg16712 [Pararge aegeria aegeria]
MLSVGKPVSLVQQKKQQWAQEREEMSHLYLPWGSGERYTSRLQVRNQFASSLELHKQSSYEYQEPIQRQRSPSLPPIHNVDLNKSLEDKRHKEVLNRNLSSAKRFAFYDEDAEGDTSGYGSETLNIKNQCESFHGAPLHLRNNNIVAWQENGKDNSQLEERERFRQEEREKKLREERIEELRIQKQQEEDRLRLEEEKRRSKEKQLFEQRKLETLKRALEDAEKKARQDKEKKFNFHRQTALLVNESIGQEKLNDIVTCDTTQLSPTKTSSPSKTHRTYNVQSATSQKENNSQQTSAFNSPRSLAASNLNLFIHNVPPLTLTDNQFNIVPIGITSATEIVNGQSNNIQLAVLVPQTKNVYSMSLNSIDNIHELGEIQKILTPSKYRSLRTKNACTQTDTDFVCKSFYERVEKEEIERTIDRHYPNIDENAPQDHRSTIKKDRRLRSEERYKKDIESRPKWGANRPVAQYKKQSEKDPFYTQKRKIRQKHRPHVRQYISQSSDDSRSPSPQTRSEKSNNNVNQRHSLSQSYWRNKRCSLDYSANNTCEIANNTVPEFTSLAQITGVVKIEQKKSPKVSPSKRLTLSQKFINDKYGSRKIWTDDVNDRSSKYCLSDLDNPRRNSDKMSILTRKKDINEKSEPQENSMSKLKL